MRSMFDELWGFLTTAQPWPDLILSVVIGVYIGRLIARRWLT